MPPPLRQRIIVDTSGVRRGYKEAADGARDYGRTSRREAQSAGTAFTRLGGLAKKWLAGTVASAATAVAVALARSTAAAAKFNAEMAQTATLAGGRAGIRGLSDQILAIGKRLPVALSDLTSGLYQAVSAGVEVGKSAQFIEVAARAAVGGNATVTQSVQGLTAAMNGFNREAGEASDISDTLFTGVRRGVTTFGELAAQIGTVSGLANEANLTLEETVAATAALTLTTNDTSRAATQLRGIVQKAIKPTEQGKEALEQYGLAFDAATIKEKGFRQALTDVVQGLQAQGVSLGTVFEDVEGLTGALTLTNAQSESFASILADMETKQGAASDAFRIMRDEATSLWETIKRRVSVSFIELGQRVLPAATSAMRGLLNLMGQSAEEVAESISELRAEIRGLDDAEEAARVVDELRGKQNLTEEQSRDLKEALATLSESFPFYVSQMNAAGEATDFFTGAIRRQAEAARRLNYAQQAEGLKDLVDRLRQSKRAQENILNLTDDIANRQIPAQEALLGTSNTSDEVRRAPGRIRALQSDLERYGKLARDAARQTNNLVLQLGPLFESAPDSQGLFRTLIDQGVVDNMAEAAALFTDITTQYRGLTEGTPDLKGGAASAVLGEEPEKVAETLSQRIQRLQEARDALVEQGVATDELVRINRELYEAEGLRDKLLESGTKDLKDQTATLEEQLALQKKLNDARVHYLSRLRERGLDPGGLLDLVPGDIPVSQPAPTSSVKGRLRSLVISEETREAVEKFNENLKRSRKNADDLGKTLNNVARAGRSLLNVADAFGSISDEARRAAQGALDIVDNISALQALGTGASALDLAVPYAGIAGGIISLVAPLFRGDDAQVEAVKENTRRIEQAIKELGEQMREGEGLTSNQGKAIRDAFVEARYQTAIQEAGSSTGGVRDAYDALFALLEEAGIDTSGFRGALAGATSNISGNAPIVEDPITGELREDWTAAFEQFNEDIDALDTSILAIVDQLDQPGLFKNSVSGVLGGAQFAQTFGAIDGQQAFAQIVSGLQGLGDVDMGALAAYLNTLADLDPLADQDEIKALIADIATASASGANFGDLTSGEIDDILSALQGLLGSGSGALVGSDTLVQQVQQSITTFQANEIVVILEEIASLLRSLVQNATTPGFSFQTAPAGAFAAGGVTVNVGGVTTGVGEKDIPYIMRAIETSLRSQLV